MKNIVQRYGGVCLACFVACSALWSVEKETVTTTSLPRAVRKLQFTDYGSRHIRIGDLDGDALPDVLLVQQDVPSATITCLTAIDLQGRILWRVGRPDARNVYYRGDNVQIYDLDGDGQNEVIYNSDQKRAVTILDGKTGSVKRRVPLSRKYDTILFVDFGGRGYPQEVFMMHAEGDGFSIFDKDFNILWSKHTSDPLGHFPANYDLDGDGKDELLVGYTLYDHTGKELWNHREFPEHNDSTYIADMDGDGVAEIAIATSRDAVLLNRAGRVLFRKAMTHCQHALIGKFRRDRPGKQVFFVSREDKKPGTDFGYAKLSMFTITGEELWNRESTQDLWVTAAQTIDNWTGKPDDQLIAIYGRWFSPPALIDGYGQEITKLLFPPAILDKGDGRFVPVTRKTGPDGRPIYNEHHVDHMACYGDEREEIFVYNEKALYIYTNAALWQRPRLYNHNYFPGRR